MKGRDRDHPVPDRHVSVSLVENVHDLQVGRGRVPVARGGLADVRNGGRAATVYPIQHLFLPYGDFSHVFLRLTGKIGEADLVVTTALLVFGVWLKADDRDLFATRAVDPVDASGRWFPVLQVRLLFRATPWCGNGCVVVPR